MNKDIRITVGLCDHHKTIKLIRKSGEGAFRCLVRLWLYTAEHRPNGILTGMDRSDVAIASGWIGDEHEWVEDLISVGWLEMNAEGEYVIHDWEEHNPYAFHAVSRSEQAKKAAKAKWDKRKSADRNAASMNEHSAQHKNSNAPSPVPSPVPSPAPSPVPSPVPNNSVSNDTGASAPESDGDWLWLNGVAYLSTRGLTDKQARSMIGKWRKKGDATARAAVQSAMYVGTNDPIPYIQKYLEIEGAKSANPYQYMIDEAERTYAGVSGLPRFKNV